MKFEAIIAEVRTALQKDTRSLADIGRVAGIPPSSLSAFMNRRNVLSIERLERLAEALGLSIKLERIKKV